MIKVDKITFLLVQIIYSLFIIVENVVLRTPVGNSNRHTPWADRRTPSTISSPEKPLASMYALETRYQPSPARLLPKRTDSNLVRESPVKNESMLLHILNFKKIFYYVY